MQWSFSDVGLLVNCNNATVTNITELSLYKATTDSNIELTTVATVTLSTTTEQSG